MLIGGRRSTKRWLTRASLLVGDIILLVAVVAFISNSTSSQAQGSKLSPPATPAVVGTLNSVNPLDQLSSATIALTVARLDNLPEATAVANQADSETALLSVASTNNSVTTKPQVVATNYVSNRDIRVYVTQPGDNITSIAQKFNLTSNSLLWSNNIVGNYVAPGTKLLIPPVNGIVYTVKAGDTPTSLAQKFSANESLIIAYNDAEIKGIYTGERIIIPNGTEAPAASYYAYGFAWGSGAIYGFNGYDWGECTWYVATQISVPANWGNADTWYIGARESGWNVSSTPTVGAIADTAAGYLGHVAIVKAISANGQEVNISEMNDWGAPGGGFDRVDSIWEPTATYPYYITRP